MRVFTSLIQIIIPPRVGGKVHLMRTRFEPNSLPLRNKRRVTATLSASRPSSMAWPKPRKRETCTNGQLATAETKSIMAHVQSSLTFSPSRSGGGGQGSPGCFGSEGGPPPIPSQHEVPLLSIRIARACLPLVTATLSATLTANRCRPYATFEERRAHRPAHGWKPRSVERNRVWSQPPNSRDTWQKISFGAGPVLFFVDKNSASQIGPKNRAKNVVHALCSGNTNKLIPAPMARISAPTTS